MSCEIRDRWYEDAARRRRLPEGGEALVPLLTGSAQPSREVAMAVARTLVMFVGGRNAQLSFEHGACCADVLSGHVNLDGKILAGIDDLLACIRQLFGTAAHEGGHLAHTTPEQIPRDPLFKAIGNVLEDERIDAIVARELPVLVSAQESARTGLLTPAADDGGFLAAVFTLVRCTDRISPALWDRYAARLEAVIEALTPYPQTPDEIRRATLQVALLVPPEQREDLPPSWSFDWRAGGEGGDALDDEAMGGLRDPRSPGGGRPLGNAPGICGAWPRVDWRDAKADLSGYGKIRARLGRKPELLANRIQQILPRRPATRRNSGRLDAKRLHAHEFDPNLFRSRSSSERVALAIVVILDLSNSMSGPSEEIAQEMALLLAEAVRQLPEVRIEFFGHDADAGAKSSTRITRYPSDSQGRVPGLGSLEIGANNRDAHAIQVIGDELRASPLRNSERRIAILVADGAPSAMEFNGVLARDKTREAILWLERTWGPVLYVATDEVENLRRMVPGPSVRFRSGRSVDEFAHQLTGTLHRAVGGAG